MNHCTDFNETPKAIIECTFRIYLNESGMNPFPNTKTNVTVSLTDVELKFIVVVAKRHS